MKSKSHTQFDNELYELFCRLRFSSWQERECARRKGLTMKYNGMASDELNYYINHKGQIKR